MSYDLLTRAWIPVREGETRSKIGLRELFLHAHELTDIEASPPPAASGLWRVLTVIAARVTGLDNTSLPIEEWGELQGEVLDAGRFDPAAVEKYFAKFAGRFDLFDEDRPWLQDPRLREQCKTSSGVNKLVLYRPAGNNQVWFNHVTARNPLPVPADEAVFHLLIQLYYGPSGQCTPRTVNGVSERNTKAGPLRRTLSFHPLGRTVFESLVAGIPPARELDTGGVDLAPWEADELPDPLGVPPKPSGIAGVLTGRFQHAVLLEGSPDGESVTDAWITWAWRNRDLPARDPYLVYHQTKDGEYLPLSAEAHRALWRDFDSLILEDVGDDRRRRPVVLAAVEDLRGTLLPVLRVRAFGVDQDGQTRDKEWVTGVTPALLALAREPEVARAVSEMRQAAERVESALRDALSKAWIEISPSPKRDARLKDLRDISKWSWPTDASFRYWARAERIFWRRVRQRAFGGAAEDFLRLALEVYDEVTDAARALPKTARVIELKRALIFRARKRSGSKSRGRGDG